jgi:hypothetical protein
VAQPDKDGEHHGEHDEDDEGQRAAPRPLEDERHDQVGSGFTGNLAYHDKANAINLHSTSITSVFIQRDNVHAIFTGTATVNGVAGYAFTVSIEDNGDGKQQEHDDEEPGIGVDRFRLQFSGPTRYDSNAVAAAGGLLTAGHIEVHRGEGPDCSGTSAATSCQGSSAPQCSTVPSLDPSLPVADAGHRGMAHPAPASGSVTPPRIDCSSGAASLTARMGTRAVVPCTYPALPWVGSSVVSVDDRVSATNAGVPLIVLRQNPVRRPSG